VDLDVGGAAWGVMSQSMVRRLSETPIGQLPER
jgi:hypothetical protein